jgi:cell shape-determining protein MreC
MEKIAKGKIDFNANHNTNSFGNSVKYVRSNSQEGSNNISGEELKLRFQKLAKEKEDLEMQNKKLTEKLNFYENKQDSTFSLP